MSEPGAPAFPVLLFFGVLTLGALGVYGLIRRATRRARSAPPTPSSAFSREVPEVNPRTKTRPRLSGGGRIAVMFACLSAVLGAAVTAATLASLAASPVPVSIALLPALVFDLAFLVLALKLRRDYVLGRYRRLTRGKVVGYAFGSRGYSVLAYYDFPDAQGAVTRGSSFLANYTSASAYLKTAPGAGVEVLYLTDKPQRNALKLGLWWMV
jgi:hypothetical protein